jgi:endogenous inhibitor of DNA gyrase (YacG/DUF329 family)
MPEKEVSIVPGPPCPICGKPAVQSYNPFCSKRCADVDLNRWLSGVYRIAGKEDEEDSGEAANPSAAKTDEKE